MLIYIINCVGPSIRDVTVLAAFFVAELAREIFYGGNDAGFFFF
jgi:hypothetical protein